MAFRITSSAFVSKFETEFISFYFVVNISNEFVESLPIITGKMPFASGSNVPMWPILVFPNNKFFIFLINLIT